MADKKITQLTAKGSALAATDLVEIAEDDGAGGYVTKSVTGANIAASVTPSGIAGAIQFSNGTALDSDATNLFYDDTNNRLGVGQNVPTARIEIKGTGTTNATSSLLVQNSAGTSSLQCTDDLSVFSHGKGAVATNTVFGKGSFQGTATGAFNVAIGVEAFKVAGSANQSVAIGYQAMAAQSSGGFNIAIGYQSLMVSSYAPGNTAVGYHALKSTTGPNNVGIGFQAGALTAAQTDNVFIGSEAKGTGSSNTVIGRSANGSTFTGSLVLGKGATATANNQCVFGSSTTVAGAVLAESNSSTNVWNVIINGVARKILLA